ncbi:hypothetical protein PPTG_22375 [Phytophthora nicotianae INRA-310]|uniref:Uncharacterized protein n=1 Tax=Phytophthora nicotianae (strain INRA-310) TaxID=761204 RepID=W2QJ50_PHYN3|nr:hypothetical protein PPTG_22375 [Phytophthora nicotianae INRA-310]ETN12599.1 hypothetical protein PPTG_22375 [Phytophthora nicotianae INRA-310]
MSWNCEAVEHSDGVGVEPVATFENLDGREDLNRRNFTDQEMVYANSAALWDAGRKETVVTATSNFSPTEPNRWKSCAPRDWDLHHCNDRSIRADAIVPSSRVQPLGLVEAECVH